MTCIIGLLEDNKIYIGGDSAASSNYYLRIRKDPKIFVKETNIETKFLVGCSGSVRMNQILRFKFDIPVMNLEKDIKCDPLSYMVSSFVSDLRDTFKNEGYAQIKDNVESHDGLFIIGFNNHLFTIYSDFQVEEVIENYTAIGGGQDFALGALRILQESALCLLFDPLLKIRLALEAAEAFCPSVRSPFNFLSI